MYNIYYHNVTSIGPAIIALQTSIREAIKIKKWSNLGICLNLPDLPPSLGNLGSLNCYFFIAYLGFEDYEMDFEINFVFSLTKVFKHLENFRILLLILSINQMKN